MSSRTPKAIRDRKTLHSQVIFTVGAGVVARR